MALFDCYLCCEQWDQAQACYENLKFLSATCIYNERIHFLQSLGACYLTNYYATHEYWIQAQDCYEDLRTLTKACPENDQVGFQQVRGAVIILSLAVQSKKIQQKGYFVSLLVDMEMLLLKYDTSAYWQKMRSVVIETIDENQ